MLLDDMTNDGSNSIDDQVAALASQSSDQGKLIRQSIDNYNRIMDEQRSVRKITEDHKRITELAEKGTHQEKNDEQRT